MAENRGKWPFKRRPLTKVRPSDGCKGNAVPLAVERWYKFPELRGYLGNVGYKRAKGARIVKFDEALRHLRAKC